MNKLLFLLLASATSMSFAATPKNDTVAYKAAHDQAAASYKTAKAACDAQSGNAKDICEDQAKLDRSMAELDATTQFKNDKNSLEKARINVADARYELAEEKCDAQTGAAKDSCKSAAKSQQTAAINDAKAGKQAADVAQTGVDCSHLTGGDKVSCEARSKTELAKDAVADSVITTKIKTELMAEPSLKSLDVKVETNNGKVSLSGFVPSQAEADRAATVARNVKGVSDVQNSLRVK
ncbi:MAG: BON domain-containing protein [Duganella sp.]